MQVHRTERLLYTVLLVFFLTVFSAASALAGVPKVYLTGKLQEQAPKKVSVEELEKLPLTSLTTYNPFVKASNSYTGVRLSDLAKAYGADGVDNIVFTAVDDYKANFVKEEWDKYNVILATRVDDKHMELKDSGPSRTRSKITRDLIEAAGSLINRKPDGAEAIIAGCTEIPLVLGQEDLPVPYFDAVTILARAAIRYAGKTPVE